jgi:hypothetical protein
MTTELAIIEPEYLDVFSEPDLQAEIDTLLVGIRNQELYLATSFAKLGRMLHQVQTTHEWANWGFESFGRYIDDVRQKIAKGRSQIYAVLSCAERLLPSVSETDLDTMGISRAQELARYVKQSGLKVPQHLLSAALDKDQTIEQLHTAVLEELREKGEVKGKWWQAFQSGYFTPEEKTDIQQTINLSKSVLGIGAEVQDHVAHKLILLAWAQEFYSTNVGTE